MRVSLTIKDTMVPGRRVRLTTPCKQRIEHISASRWSLFQQHNGRSVKYRTTEDTCPRVSCILGVYKSKGLLPVAHSAIHSQTNSSDLLYILYILLWQNLIYQYTDVVTHYHLYYTCSHTHQWWLQNKEGSMCKLGNPWHSCDCGTGCHQLSSICMSYLKNASRLHFLRWYLLKCRKIYLLCLLEHSGLIRIHCHPFV